MSITPVSDAVYRDPVRRVEERVDDLLGRMTVIEKAAQLGSAWVFQLIDGSEMSAEKAAGLLGNGIGQVTRLLGASSLEPEEAARVANAIQRHLVTKTTLGIPAIFHEEICSGLMARRTTVFPQAIGLASTWQPDLIEQMADSVRIQMRASGTHQGLSPVLDIARDPRWGRTEETFGEDPHLVAALGVAFVRGLQGRDPAEGVIATAKHFVGYGASEGGLNWAPAHIPPREMREVYLHPFEAVVRTAGLSSVMNAYHELDGVPCAADRDLLTGLLRETWGFEGSVVSDYFAIRQLHDYHRLVSDGSEAAALALEAGLDVELPGTDCYGEPLLAALESGRISTDLLDTSVRRVLRAKFELGLFEDPYVDVAGAVAASAGPAQRRLAATVARKSIVLLRNDGILPLAGGSVAVIGPNADDARNLFGDYTYPAHVESLLEMRDRGTAFALPTDEVQVGGFTVTAPTVLDELRDRLGPGTRYARGCDINSRSREGFAEAVELAAASDVAIMVMGDKAGLTDDCTSGEGRDRVSLELPGVQEDLIREVVATGTPVVLVLVTGRPGASVWAHEHSAAVLLAWLPGEEGAGAIADVLTGQVSPGGKLPITYPRDAGQVPVYYSHKVSGGRSHWKGDYVDSPSQPLYPFGHGLSYTSFRLDDIIVSPDTVTPLDAVSVSVSVSNIGSREGDEVVQLYVRDPVASVTRPVLELKGFVRLTLAPGESRRVSFDLPVGQVGFYDRQLEYLVEPGTIDVLVGTSAAELAEAGSFTVVADPDGRPTTKMFDGTVHIGGSE